jgi:hypothetical protein
MIPKIPAYPVDRWTSWTRPRAVGRLRDVRSHAVSWLGIPRSVTRPDTHGLVELRGEARATLFNRLVQQS